MCPRSLVTDSGLMTLRTAEQIAAVIDHSIAWEIDFAGRGEPTIHPRLLDLARVMTTTGVPVCVVTTGVKMTPSHVRSMDECFDLIRLSVSSTDRATFAQIHVGLDYDHIWRNIRALADVAAHKTVIHLTGGPRIYDHLPATVNSLRKMGFEAFRLLSLWNRGGYFETDQDRARRQALMDDLDIPPSENEAWTGSGKVRFFAGFVAHRMRNRHFCPIGNASLSIAWDGRILGCFQDFGHTSIVGHVEDVDIRAHLRTRTSQLGTMKVCEGCDAKEVTLFSWHR